MSESSPPPPPDAGPGHGPGEEPGARRGRCDLAAGANLSVDLVLSGHRHVPVRVARGGGMYIVHSGTVSTLRTRGFPHPAYNLIKVENGRIFVELKIPGGEQRSLGEYPRDWPGELVGRHHDPFVRAQRGESLAND